MSKEFKEEFLIPLIVIVFGIVGVGLFFRAAEEYIFWMGGIINEHNGKRCERAIKNNTIIPYYCNTGTLYNN